MIKSKILGLASIFLFLFLLPFSFGQPFISQSSEDILDAFSVIIPSEQSYKKDSQIKIVATVFNSTGKLLGPTNSVSCRTQILDENNELIIDQEMSFSKDQFNITIGSEVTSKQLRRQYKIFCNTSTQGGFRTGEFLVTESGLPEKTEQTLLIIIMILAILLFIFALNFKDPNLAFASGMLFIIIGLYLFRFGYVGIQNFLSDSTSIILMGIGCYILFRTTVEHLNEADE